MKVELICSQFVQLFNFLTPIGIESNRNDKQNCVNEVKGELRSI